MEPKADHPQHGDFYMSDPAECLTCGVPQHEAPDLVGWTESTYRPRNSPNELKTFTHCYWKRQPETPGEIRQAIAVLNGQELDCHRYRGTDPDIIVQISGAVCDRRSGIHNLYTPQVSNLKFLLLDDDLGLVARLRRWLKR